MRRLLACLVAALAIGASSAQAQSHQTFILQTASGALSAATTTSAVNTVFSKALIFLNVTTITTPDADDEVDFYVQTTYDGGTTWTDVENIHFALADNGTTAKKVVSIGVVEFLAADTAIDSTDGALADDTKIKAALGSQIRIKTAVTGATAPTYAFSARGIFR